MVALDWVESLKSRFGEKIISVRESAPGEPEFKVLAADAEALLEALRSLEGGPFLHLADLTAYDEHPQSPRFHVVYELISMLRKARASVIAVLDDAEPVIGSVCHLWGGANWLEREAYDMFGIRFAGHPDHRRILLPEAFQGHPLKKDFLVDYRQPFPEPVTEDAGIFDPFGNTLVKPRGEG